MNFTEFVHAMKHEVTEQMEPGVAVELHAAVKNNGTKRQGLLITASGVNISPAIYLEEFYERYQGGRPVPYLAKEIRDLYDKVRIRRSYPYESFFSYPNLKDKIVYKLVQKETNRELLQNVPWEKYLDFAKVYYALIEDEILGSAMMQINYEHLRDWGVTEEEIRECAEINTPLRLPEKIMPMSDTMYVLTNEQQSLGAAVMCYPDTLKKAAEQLGDDFYLIPSSIHECILVSAACGVEKDHLRHMLVEINRCEVSDEEILSDQVYFYSRKAGRLG